MAGEKNQWHLRKDVTVVNLISLIAAVVGGMWFIMEMKTGLSLLEQRIASSEARIERFEQRTGTSVTDLKEDMNDRFDRIESKLDRMNE